MSENNNVIEHPAFPQPSNLNARVWRYLDYWKFEWLLSERRLAMPAADKLGDEFEGSTPQAEIDWWNAQVSTAQTADEREIITSNMEKLSAFAKAFRPIYFVTCWIMKEQEDISMWDRYTSLPESVAVYTNYSDLHSALPKHVNLGVVRYIDYSKERLPTLNMYHRIMTKRIEYDVEREVRGVADGKLPTELGGNGLRKDVFTKDDDSSFLVFAPVIDLKQLIQGIVTHPKAKTDFCKRVQLLAESMELPTPVVSTLSAKPCF